jgi:hypothetical protein
MQKESKEVASVRGYTLDLSSIPPPSFLTLSHLLYSSVRFNLDQISNPVKTLFHFTLIIFSRLSARPLATLPVDFLSTAPWG